MGATTPIVAYGGMTAISNVPSIMSRIDIISAALRPTRSA